MVKSMVETIKKSDIVRLISNSAEDTLLCVKRPDGSIVINLEIKGNDEIIEACADCQSNVPCTACPNQ
jgi:hypothetical protein